MSDPIYDHYQKEEKVINHLTFDHVTTFYHGYPETAVKDINFTASANEIIDITGEVACGKSLLGKALVSEADYQGQILLRTILMVFTKFHVSNTLTLIAVKELPWTV
ncbi:hypothetical protein PF585_07250 [Lactobacillus delbrueckii]|uniref:hypothetical protein n=1 Tax=Lactobacillus delbrueckii TaxID=1584 RepID=UPI0022EBFEDC|nr:hypothetical protein [Lactobacillus delbrueckii]MDA3801867.1 hypothetical protein [Lactobacillus delbrueckii]